MSKTDLLIAGDLCPIGKNTMLFEKGRGSEIYGMLTGILEAADLRVANLECPLIQAETPIEKIGPILGAPSSVIDGICAGGFDVLGLANNHIMDHGQAGLKTTLSECRNASIVTVGAGFNRKDAASSIGIEVNGLNVGIHAVAEHEFSIASDEVGGANPIDLISLSKRIVIDAGRFDYLMVLVHAGKEHYPYPSPRLQDLCRFLIDHGANLVICQHSHCIGAYERYLSGQIIYGQGDFIFDSEFDSSERRRHGILVLATIEKNRTVNCDLIPIIQDRRYGGVDKAPCDLGERILSEIRTRSARILDREFVEKNWEEFCDRIKDRYFSIFRGHPRYLRALNKRIPFAQHLYTKKGLMALHNTIRCESHYEVVDTILRMRNRDV